MEEKTHIACLEKLQFFFSKVSTLPTKNGNSNNTENKNTLSSFLKDTQVPTIIFSNENTENIENSTIEKEANNDQEIVRLQVTKNRVE